MSGPGVSLEVVDLAKSWGAVDVLQDVNFGIEPGGFLTLLGPSGCGKSTILRLVSGLDEVSGGQILIGGKDVARIPAAERNIGMVFQNYALFPHMTIAENITYGLNVRKVPKAEKEKALARVAELMALGKLLDRKPSQLSGGQQQRVALARVLVSDRPLVLMDEPLSNLDAKLRVEIRSEIRSLNKKLGITVVYVTHDQSEALSMSDRVVLMNAGNVSQVGTPQELYDRPANTFAAAFIGTPPMNLLSPEDVRAPATFAPEGGMEARDVIFGVRPESLSLGRAGAEFSATARVESLEYEGKVFLVHLIAPSGTRFIAAHSGDGAPEEGSEVTVGWSASQTHLFSKTDGNRRDFTL
ncbi:ATP-binding cassette domain-containing protein [Alphaproteobacteria bacterium GH1-50]|uniref:ATP-binding cassette domain-containing protein n=1 Tax=Kangsaoukella pontilimi TaxID=2691042 RepID=A0A7C9MT39_9RHOB|nr:ABC transporter ATP-binding protein [Kangsaoukella pontilimi]MXQ09857.1 ATP-binding cassette domain-containing protein [Kangsaoukella pontilimi]